MPAFLYVVYIEDDGTVVNLRPRRGPLREQTQPTDKPLLFGDGREGRPTFRITGLRSTDEAGQPRAKGDPHRGHEAIIVIAARAPIQELEDEEKVDSRLYRVSAKASAAEGPPDRLLLSRLRDIVTKRVAGSDLPSGVDAALPREVMADVLHLRIED